MAAKEDNVVKKEPSYPFYALPRSLSVGEAVRGIGGGRGAVPKSLIAQRLNVKQTASSFAQLLSSAKAFGIIQGRSDYSLTDEGAKYFAPTDEHEKQLAGLTFLAKPTAFKMLLDRYDGGRLPQREMLKNVLMRDAGVPESWVDRVAGIFLGAIKELGLLDAGGHLRYEAAQHGRLYAKSPEPFASAEQDYPQAEQSAIIRRPTQAAAQSIAPEGPDMPRTNVWVYGEGDAVLRLETPAGMTRSLWSKLSKYVAVLEPTDSPNNTKPE